MLLYGEDSLYALPGLQFFIIMAAVLSLVISSNTG